MPLLHKPSDWHWLSLQGPDAKDFLHRLTTVNLKTLPVGRGATGCFLNALGRVRAYFTLWNYGDGEYGFEYAGGQEGKWKKELLATIDQYTFAEKFTLSDVTELECRWIFPSPGEDLGIAAGETRAIDDEIRLCHHRDMDYGRDWITAWGRPARLTQWLERSLPGAQSVSPQELEKWRVHAIRPRLDSEINENTIPLEVGLHTAIAQNKGCYPGQEVIERIIALGRPPRRLALIEGQGPAPKIGDKIMNLAEPPAEVGQITSVVSPESGRFEALGLVRKIHAQEGLPVRIGEGAQASIVRIAPYV